MPFLSLFLHLVYFSLKLSGISSFPKPLTAGEESRYLQKMADGDEHARAKLIERNLRLVAHIIKNSYYKVQRNNSCFKTLINKGFPDIGLFSRLLYRRRQYLKPHILIVSGNILTTLKIYSCVTKLDTHATNYISK
jgi:hypothetical protein